MSSNQQVVGFDLQVKAFLARMLNPSVPPLAVEYWRKGSVNEQEPFVESSATVE